MIAEINNKVDIDTDDQLTGNVIGALRYLPYIMFREIISECVKPESAKDALMKALPVDYDIEWGRNVKFWPRYKYDLGTTEPDVVLNLDDADTVIMIEAKYLSHISIDYSEI